jgi:hypothetical protein
MSESCLSLFVLRRLMCLSLVSSVDLLASLSFRFKTSFSSVVPWNFTYKYTDKGTPINAKYPNVSGEIIPAHVSLFEQSV